MAKKEPLISISMKDVTKTYTEAEFKGGQIIETTRPVKERDVDEKGPRIKKGKVDSLMIYEVTEGEFETIERGSPNSTYFNIGIALLSSAISFFVTLFTVDLSQRKQLFTVFTIIAIVGLVVGGVLVLLWARSKNDVDVVLKRIRNRMTE